MIEETKKKMGIFTSWLDEKDARYVVWVRIDQGRGILLTRTIPTDMKAFLMNLQSEYPAAHAMMNADYWWSFAETVLDAMYVEGNDRDKPSTLRIS